MLILPDSGVWISFFEADPDAAADELANLLDAEADVCVCGPTMMEVLQGIRVDKEHNAIATTLDNAIFLDATRDTYLQASAIYRTCQGRGFTIRSSMDCIVAATALAHGAHLLHHDRDFTAIAKFFPLKIF